MERSCFTLDLGAIRRNAATLLRAARAELWAVVKAEGYGHGAVDVSKAALGRERTRSASTLPEALHLRAALRNARILVMGPVSERDRRGAVARLELVAADEQMPEGVRVHLKIDTGMGRWGLSEAPSSDARRRRRDESPRVRRVGPAFTQLQVARFREATAGLGSSHGISPTAPPCCASRRRGSTQSGAASRSTASRRSARIRPTTASSRPCAGSRTSRWSRARAGREHGLRPPHVADRPTWIGVVPVGYADGFRRDMTGTDVLVEGVRRRVVGTISMDALAVVLDAPVESGTPVTLVGDGVLIEEHARVADTIAYEIATGLNTRSAGPGGSPSMDERLRELLGDEDAWVVGGAIRDQLLLRPVLDLDVVCRAARRREPLRPAIRRLRLPALGTPRRVASRRRRRSETVDFTPVGDGIDADLATRDFTFNAIAVRGDGRDARSARGPCGSRGRRHPSRVRVDLRRRPAAAPARGPVRDELDSQWTRRPGTSPCLGRARHGARGRARPRRARAALGRRYRRRRGRSPRASSAARRAPGRARRLTSGSSPSSATTSAGCRSRTS